MRSKSSMFFALPVVLLSAVLVYGQGTSGTILGTVTDPQGAVIAGVTVSVKNLDTQRQRQVTTDSSGYYRVEALPVGRYEVRAERQGFKVTLSSLTLTVAEEAVTNFKMEVGSLSEQVIVTSTGTEVETTTATMGGLVDEKKIRDLPLNGRSFDQLIYLQPGVTVATSAGASPNQGRGTKFSVSGARLTSNLFMLDGTDMNDSQNFTPGGAGGQMFGVESIKEFKVVTHFAQVPDADARAGRIIDRVTGKVTTVTINSAVVPYLNLIPRANGSATATPGVAILQFSNQQPAHVNYVTGRIDWNRTSKDSLFGRYTIDDSTKLRQDAPDHVLGLFAENEGHRNQYITLQDTRILSSTKVNQLRFGFNRSTLHVDLVNQANVPASLSFIPGQPFGHISITGMSPVGTVVNDPRAFYMNSYQPSDDFSVTHVNHAFKTGVFIERFQWNTSA